MYYFCQQDLSEARNIIEIEGHTEETGKYLWTAGHKFPEPIGHQVLMLDPSYGTELADFFDTTIPVMSDRLIEALHEIGVDNFDIYPVTLKRKDTGEEFTNYKAVNFIGRIDAIDLEKSEYEMDEDFDEPDDFGSVVIDDSKVHGQKAFRLDVGPDLLVVNEEVAKHLMSKNFVALMLQKTEEYDDD